MAIGTNIHRHTHFRMIICRISEDPKSRRGFGSLLRRHTSFGAQESNGRHGGSGGGAGGTLSGGGCGSTLMTSPQDYHEY